MQARWRPNSSVFTQSVACAGENLLLAFHALGLGARWLADPLYVPDVVRRVLSLPKSWLPQGLVIAGYPGGGPRPRQPARLAEIVLER
ncbi:MAG: nitroreductase family protein [Dehalococcoidia bacterium]|nr:nitroreductase family protein [Dehalococcoidia bacterium]